MDSDEEIKNKMDESKEQQKSEQNIVTENDINKNEEEMISLKLTAKSEFFEIKIKQKIPKNTIGENIDKIIHEISKSKSFKAKPTDNKPTSIHQTESKNESENSIKLLAMKLDVDPDKFENLKIIGIKGEAIQLLKPSKLKPSESCYLLIAVNEFVLGKLAIQYDELKEMCELNGIRSKTPFYQIIDNAKRYGHIDKKKYDNAKEVVLQSKGLDLLRSALNKAMNN